MKAMDDSDRRDRFSDFVRILLISYGYADFVDGLAYPGESYNTNDQE